MSLARFVYYSAVVSGWAAFVGWLIVELLFFRSGEAGGRQTVLVVGGTIGAAIGGGLSVVAGVATGYWKRLAVRVLAGLLGGCIGGTVGAILGDILYESVGLPRAIGWAIMGIGIGIADGAYDRSSSKIRNGLIGGAIGGLIGGFLFDPIQQLVASSSGMSSRASAFVILGICIGSLIGLTHVVLKHAWLTVIDGYQCGRQLILSQETTVIGRAEHLPLPLLGPSNQQLELEHLKIIRQVDGTFLAQDDRTRIGSRLNGQPITYPTRLQDGDVLKLGRNSIRFNVKQKRQDEESLAKSVRCTAPLVPLPPKPSNRPAAPNSPVVARSGNQTKTATPQANQPTAASGSVDERPKPRTPPPPPPPRRPKS